jgi:hypothetical protein
MVTLEATYRDEIDVQEPLAGGDESKVDEVGQGPELQTGLACWHQLLLHR